MNKKKKSWCIDNIKVIANFFCAFLARHIALSDSVELKKCEVIDVYAYKTTAQYVTVVNNQEQLSQLEDLVQYWCKQIEQVNVYIIWTTLLSVLGNLV